MIFKKALIALLLAGGAISFTACGKKDKPATTQAPTPVTPDDPTPSPTPAPTVKYEDYPDVSKYTPYKLTLKDKYLLEDCLDTINDAKYTSIVMNHDMNQYVKYGDSIVNMKMAATQTGTLYNNNVLNTAISNKLVIEGNIPQELMVLIPDNYKIDMTMDMLYTNNSKYLFKESIVDIVSAPSSMPPMTSTKTVTTLPTSFNIKDADPSFPFYPDSAMIGEIDITSKYINVYKIDDTHFVSTVRYIDTEDPDTPSAKIYDPSTKTVIEGEISVYEFYSQTCYFSVTPAGKLQLDYFFDEEGTESFFATYQDTTTLGISENLVVNVGKLQTQHSTTQRMIIDYSAKPDYADKQKFINSYDIDFVTFGKVREYWCDADTYAAIDDAVMPAEVVEQTFDSITFDTQINLHKGEAVYCVAGYTYNEYNPKVISDEAISGALYTEKTGAMGLSEKTIIDKINNKDIVLGTHEGTTYITIDKDAQIAEGYHYEIFINATVKKYIDTDNTTKIDIVVNSASAVLMPN